jgi:hypothetical protein
VRKRTIVVARVHFCLVWVAHVAKRDLLYIVRVALVGNGDR